MKAAKQPDQDFKCPACGGKTFTEDFKRSLVQSMKPIQAPLSSPYPSEQPDCVEFTINNSNPEKSPPVVLGPSTNLPSSHFYLMCRQCGYQLPELLERPKSVTATFFVDGDKK